jgi:hypothetical protein
MRNFLNVISFSPESCVDDAKVTAIDDSADEDA